MKAEEIIKIIQDNQLQESLFNESNSKEYLAELGLPSFEQLDYVCNSDEMYCIIHFKDEDIYLKFTGEYDSYGGGDHYYNDEIKQVFPKQVTITQYLENGL